MRGIFFILVISVLVAGSVMAGENNIGLGFWGRYDQVVFSKPACLTAWGLWSVTAYELQSHPEEYEGPGRFVAGDHVNLGFGLYTLGYFLKNYSPDAWDEMSVVRALCRLGWIVELDDVAQHLVIQRQDDFGPGKTGQYKIGYIQKAYRWIIDPGRDNDRAKVMLTLLSTGRNSLSIGYFQGPAVQVGFGRVEVLPGVNFSSALLVGYGYCRKTELAVEQVLIGPEVEVRIYKKIYLSMFVGGRTLDKRAGAKVERSVYGWGLNIK